MNLLGQLTESKTIMIKDRKHSITLKHEMRKKMHAELRHHNILNCIKPHEAINYQLCDTFKTSVVQFYGIPNSPTSKMSELPQKKKKSVLLP